MHKQTLTAASMGIALAGVAWAHAGHGEAAGFVSGFMHPVSGLDHVLAMLAVGLYAAALGGRALFVLPSAFVGVMLAGFGLGAAGVELPQVEFFIALSVIVLGAFVALRIKLPVFAGAGLCALFAVFHGHAHGAEMAEGASGIAYAGGFILATAGLHALGLAAGLALPGVFGRMGLRLAQGAGAITALTGAALLTGAV